MTPENKAPYSYTEMTTSPIPSLVPTILPKFPQNSRNSLEFPQNSRKIPEIPSKIP